MCYCGAGCGLLVSEIFLDEERSRPSRALLQALSMTEGRQRSATEYSDLLKKHGFSIVETRYTDNLLDAMLFVKEDPNTGNTLPVMSSESVETMVAWNAIMLKHKVCFFSDCPLHLTVQELIINVLNMHFFDFLTVSCTHLCNYH